MKEKLTTLLQDKKLLAVIGAALVVVILLCLVLGGNKAEKTVNSYIKNLQSENTEKLYKTLPKALRTYLDEEDYEEDILELLEEASETFNDNYDDCKFKVLDVSKMSEDDLEDYADSFEDMADEIDAKLKVQAGRYVIVKVTDEDGAVSARTYEVLKVNGSWFVTGLLAYVILS